MVLIIFAILFALESVFILRYVKRTVGNEYIPNYIVTDQDLEKTRKKLNSKFSKF